MSTNPPGWNPQQPPGQGGGWQLPQQQPPMPQQPPMAPQQPPMAPPPPPGGSWQPPQAPPPPAGGGWQPPQAPPPPGGGGGWQPPAPGGGWQPPAPGGYGGQPGGSVYGIRIVAFIIDSILLGIVGGILGAIFGAFAAASVANTNAANIPGFVGLNFTFYALSFGVSLLYGTLLIGSSSGKTVGMRIMGLRVQDANTGTSIGYGRAFVRWLVYELLFVACLIPGLINLLSPLWDARGQTWHDKAANSVMVRG